MLLTVVLLIPSNGRALKIMKELVQLNTSLWVCFWQTRRHVRHSLLPPSYSRLSTKRCHRTIASDCKYAAAGSVLRRAACPPR
ncbi:hypothetical protein GGR56DRAFT_48449 [Xylariaceae sp. FL0804]|nr:hypothetical protein GGR56DRAFT_48449 [Xylariaceae sp. FL0804]